MLVYYYFFLGGRVGGCACGDKELEIDNGRCINSCAKYDKGGGRTSKRVIIWYINIINYTQATIRQKDKPIWILSIFLMRAYDRRCREV